jgi:4-carboxymuconolactone decarboxylase
MSNSTPPHSAVSPEDVYAVSPTLAKYTGEAIANGVWKRPGLSAHDRSVITIAALIARNQTAGMLHYFNVSLDNGVTPAEMSEIVTHLAFYTGWSNAFSAVAILKDVFVQRGVTTGQLPEVSPELLPLAQAVPDESVRVAFIEQAIRPTAPAFAQCTDDLLYHEVWLRPGLRVRDRNLITVSALIASGQLGFLGFYFNRAKLQGVTKAEASEMLAHLAFYAGWPYAISAVAVVKEVFGEQPA